ncbi:ADP-ribosylation factor-binding protein GGA2 [Nilaparvata lugens]|uniref:ADP-ribosylation factor-binding protein GGA2 n=1 Tax=Nilaparvata lugens TaxID=108931 RepID=UPI00193EBF0C|nr:ADP-ribosylation factor-binding protein GGA2 [Nilaparvata lugens]
MDIIITSLEALIQRATNNQNQCPDTAAIDAFCGLINQEPECAQSAARFISAKAHSMQEWEALQALNVLDTCMKKCGSNFHAEVGKFRFLNELIKLVSPKYLGAHTPEPVRRRVLELIQSWTVQYPKEPKIKEAYEMLKKQGVVKEERIGTINIEKPPEACVSPRPQADSIFQDEEKSRLLQKLLQSKKPGDLQAANKLIKTMVKEDEKRVEQKVRRLSELEAVHNNVRLLSEMLDSYRPEQSSPQDLELITELHTSCKRLRPTVFKLASEVHAEEDLFGEVFATNDELGEVFEKYNRLIVQGGASSGRAGGGEGGASLLDLGTPSQEALPPAPSTPSVNMIDDQLAGLGLDIGAPAATNVSAPRKDLASLGDIFGAAPETPQQNPLQPMATGLPMYKEAAGVGSSLVSDLMDDKSSKMKALEDLDKLGAELLRESLPNTVKPSQLIKNTSKVPMNQLNRLIESPLHQAPPPVTASKQEADFNPPPVTASSLPVTGPSLPVTASPLPVTGPSLPVTASPLLVTASSQDADDKCLDLLMDDYADQPPLDFNGALEAALPPLTIQTTDYNGALEAALPPLTIQPREQPPPQVKEESQKVKKESHTPMPLGDVFVPLENAKPGKHAPRTLLDDPSGIVVVLHMSASRPRTDVTVFVVTASSRHTSAITNYLFQPVVPKSCRLKLQPPTATTLPAHNPFVSPAVITQVMLVASLSFEPIKLKYVVSYTMDGESMTEMGELDQVPLLDS